jgi:hypothetical protein
MKSWTVEDVRPVDGESPMRGSSRDAHRARVHVHILTRQPELERTVLDHAKGLWQRDGRVIDTDDRSSQARVRRHLQQVISWCQRRYLDRHGRLRKARAEKGCHYIPSWPNPTRPSASPHHRPGSFSWGMPLDDCPQPAKTTMARACARGTRIQSVLSNCWVRSVRRRMPRELLPRRYQAIRTGSQGWRVRPDHRWSQPCPMLGSSAPTQSVWRSRRMRVEASADARQVPARMVGGPLLSENHLRVWCSWKATVRRCR